MDHLFTHRRAANGWCGRSDLRFGDAQRFGEFMRPILRLAPPFEHDFFVHADGGGVFHVQIGHGQICADVGRFFAHRAQQIAHGDGDIAKVNVNGARFFATVTNRAMVGDVFKLFPMFNRNAAPCLFFIQESFDQQRGGENFIAR